MPITDTEKSNIRVMQEFALAQFKEASTIIEPDDGQVDEDKPKDAERALAAIQAYAACVLANS